jgi:hypothetical protein
MNFIFIPVILLLFHIIMIVCHENKRSQFIKQINNQNILNYNETNIEDKVIAAGIEFYHSINHTLPRKPLLCGTFTQPSAIEASILIQDNIMKMSKQCDWIIILYNGTNTEIKNYCTNLNITFGNIIHCQRSPSTIPTRSLFDYRTNQNVTLSTPKTVLYHDLLPYLPSYKRVFLMDDDIALTDFNYRSLERLWNCAFSPPPLIVQPLVIGPVAQFLSFVNYHTWQRKDRSHIIASSVGLVEQQVPLFDSIFFQWFIQYVLINTKELALTFGADWGHDRSWCRAAFSFATNVLHYPSDNNLVVCALLTHTPPVYHLNLRTMLNKRSHREFFRYNAGIVMKKYIDLYPNWLSIDAIRPNNPLDGRNRHLYPFAYNLSAGNDFICK